MKQGRKIRVHMIFLTMVTLLVLGAVPSVTFAMSVLWNGSTSAFPSETIVFTAFTADSLESITDTTGGLARYVFAAGTTQTAKLEVRLDGSFVTLASQSGVSGSPNWALPNLTFPILFTRGSVDAIRLSSNTSFSKDLCEINSRCWRGLEGATFNFSDSTSTIPEPATMLLFGSGLAGLAGYRWHQRRREGNQVG